MRGISALKVCLAFGMDLRTMSKVPELPKEKQLGGIVFCYLYSVLVHEHQMGLPSWDGKPNPVPPCAVWDHSGSCNSTTSPARERVWAEEVGSNQP